MFSHINFVLLSLTGVCLAVKPGFDCQKAQTPIEKLICGSDALSNQDRQMNQLYNSLLDQAAEKDREPIRAEQRSFLKRRDELCNLDPTAAEKYLSEIYQERITALKAQFAYDSVDVPTAGAMMLLRVTPEGGDVQPGRQIVFQFDRPVVPIGRMERKAELNSHRNPASLQLRMALAQHQRSRMPAAAGGCPETCHKIHGEGQTRHQRRSWCHPGRRRDPYLHNTAPQDHLYPFRVLAGTRYAFDSNDF